MGKHGSFGVIALATTQVCPFWPKAHMPKNTIDVAIGGKADIGWCTSYVRL